MGPSGIPVRSALFLARQRLADSAPTKPKNTPPKESESRLPVDSAPVIDRSSTISKASSEAALKTSMETALATASAAAPGTWMIYPAAEQYRGKIAQDTKVSELKPYAQDRLGEVPTNLPLGSVLAFTGASSLTEITRNVGEYREKLDQLSTLGKDFQGGLVVRADSPQSSLVVLPEKEDTQGAQVRTFESVVRNERARTGLLDLLDSEQWRPQLEGSKLESMRGQLEKPETDVKALLTKGLAELEEGYTTSHMKRATEDVALPLAEELNMSSREKGTLREIGELYDIGKLAVDEKILNHDGKWPDEQSKDWFGKVSNHVHPDIVSPLLEAFDVSDEGREAVLNHHERPNGWAYCKDAPSSSWSEVSSVAKVVGMADTIDAMQWRKANHNRPVESKLDRATMKKFLTGDAEKGKVDGDLVSLVFDKVIPES